MNTSRYVFPNFSPVGNSAAVVLSTPPGPAGPAGAARAHSCTHSHFISHFFYSFCHSPSVKVVSDRLH